MIVFKRRKKDDYSIEIAPLIDLVFLLLIFFVINSAFLKPAIKLNLPVVASGISDKQTELILSVDKKQNIYLNNKPVDLAELIPAVKALGAKEEINFQADKSTTYDLIIKIMSKLKEAGIKNIALEYEPIK